MKKDPSEKINVPDLQHINIPTEVTARPKTPHWTDRSRNGGGFFCLFTSDEQNIDPEGTGDKKYRRN